MLSPPIALLNAPKTHPFEPVSMVIFGLIVTMASASAIIDSDVSKIRSNKE
jgi:hypothetical protein